MKSKTFEEVEKIIGFPITVNSAWGLDYLCANDILNKEESNSFLLGQPKEVKLAAMNGLNDFYEERSLLSKIFVEDSDLEVREVASKILRKQQLKAFK